MSNVRRQIENEFSKRFGDEYILVRSPGRVNLIGEHTDYNNGFVLPAAVDKSIVLALAPNGTERVRLVATNKNDGYETELSNPLEKSGRGWPDYLLGVIDQLQKRGYQVEGFDCVFGGNVPIGAGMSSSAALEGGIAFGLNRLFGWDIPPEQLAQIAQQAENRFVGMQCGIMDQFISLNAREDHAMRLDCRSLEYHFYPLKYDDLHIVLCDTQVRRELASSEYNVRRRQCEEGVNLLRKYDDAVESLRDVTPDLLEQHKDEFGPVIYDRCSFVLEENRRVLKACKDLESGDLETFGQRMYASHEGLRDKYEVSCNELDILVEETRKIKGVLGARMMGGGFGGCTINLVQAPSLDSFKKQITKRYWQRTGKETKIYPAKVAAGTHIIESTTEDV